MSIVKKLLIFFILIFTICILYKLHEQRAFLLKEAFTESMEGDNVDQTADIKSEYDSLVNTYPLVPSIGNYNGPHEAQLKDLVIKSSYNTAFTGKNYVNTDMIKFVLSRGCRFIDFELYNFSGSPYVAVGSNYESIDTLNKLALDKVLQTVDKIAFVKDSPDVAPPNPNDPMIIHLRLMNIDSEGFYENINNIINTNLGYRMASTKNVDENTRIGEIAGKYVVLIDKKSRGYLQNNGNAIITNKNGETGTTSMILNSNMAILDQRPNPPILETEYLTNVKKCNIVLADAGRTFFGYSVNPDMADLTKQYGTQIVAYKYYINDKRLSNCENTFGNFKMGITSLAQNIIYFNNKTN